MSIGVIEDFVSETFWYDVQSPYNEYVYTPAGLSNKDAVRIRAYPKDGSGDNIFVRIFFLNSSGGTISQVVTKATSTTSTNDISEIFLDIPSATVSIKLVAENESRPALVSIEYFTFSFLTPKSPVKYTTSQNITITNSASVALLGGGGGTADSTGNTTHNRPGAGSGYLTHATVSPGNYSLTIGAGGVAGTTAGPGGTTSFATFNAAGGSGTNNNSNATGSGGSSGGMARNSATDDPLAQGGFNGGGNVPSNAPGSGVVAQLFSPGLGGTWPGGAGGLYGGGAGAIGTPNNFGRNTGQSAAAGSGGGAGGSSGSANVGGASGGTGGSGALWILES
jgi:hypothetical protein